MNGLSGQMSQFFEALWGRLELFGQHVKVLTRIRLALWTPSSMTLCIYFYMYFHMYLRSRG